MTQRNGPRFVTAKAAGRHPHESPATLKVDTLAAIYADIKAAESELQRLDDELQTIDNPEERDAVQAARKKVDAKHDKLLGRLWGARAQNLEDVAVKIRFAIDLSGTKPDAYMLGVLRSVEDLAKAQAAQACSRVPVRRVVDIGRGDNAA